MSKTRTISTFIIIIIILSGCIDQNNDKSDVYTPMELRSVANIGIYVQSASIRDQSQYNAGDKIILRGNITDIHIVNKTDAESYVGLKINYTVICFIDSFENIYFDDPLAGAYVGHGIPILSKLSSKNFNINDVVEIILEIQLGYDINNDPGLYFSLYVPEKNIIKI